MVRPVPRPASRVSEFDLRQAIRNPWWLAAGVLALAAVVATAQLGGFEKAESKSRPLPRLAAGQRYDNGALAVTPLRAWISDREPGKDLYDWKQVDYLVLQVTLENLTPRSTSGFGYPMSDVILLTPDGMPVKAKSAAYSRDHLLLSDLGPRLPTQVDLIWELPKGMPADGKRSWGVFRRAFQEKAHLNDESAWVQGPPGARFELPVEDRRPRVGVAP